jgi:hypothetical protein
VSRNSDTIVAVHAGKYPHKKTQRTNLWMEALS